MGTRTTPLRLSPGCAVSCLCSKPANTNPIPCYKKRFHVATIIDLLETYDAALIPPCNYSFPINSTEEFFEIANIITSSASAQLSACYSLAVTESTAIQSVSSILTC